MMTTVVETLVMIIILLLPMGHWRIVSRPGCAGLGVFEEYSEWMYAARKLNIDGKGDFLYFLIGGKPINRGGKIKLEFRVYIHTYTKLSCRYDGQIAYGVYHLPENLWINGFLRYNGLLHGGGLHAFCIDRHEAGR